MSARTPTTEILVAGLIDRGLADEQQVGIDIGAATPTRWDDAMLQTADVIVTMGCGDECPFYPGRRYLDWELTDPAGKPIDEVRPIRDDIERRVRGMLAELQSTEASG